MFSSITPYSTFQSDSSMKAMASLYGDVLFEERQPAQQCVRIEIDEAKKQKQLSELNEGGFLDNLAAQARAIRAKR